MHRVNPLHGMPAATGIGAALEKIPFIASFSSYLDDTTMMADLILPDDAILESWGDDVPDPGPGYQTVGIQQPVVRPVPRHSQLLRQPANRRSTIGRAGREPSCHGANCAICCAKTRESCGR